MTDPVKPVASWRKVLAAFLDFFTVFYVASPQSRARRAGSQAP